MNWAGLQFLNWQWLILIPLLWAYLAWWYQQKQSARLRSSISDIDLSFNNHFYHPLAAKLIKASESLSQAKQPLWNNKEFWLYSIILSLLITALAEPILIGNRLPDPPHQRDIVFLVDTSVSMQLKDYQQQGKATKCIDVLRNLLDEFTARMHGEKISVILFAEQSYVLVPLSSDQNLIRQMLGRITSTLAGRYTALGDALLMALNESQLEDMKLQADNKTKRHTTIILFTDADASRGKVTSSAAAKIIAENEIPVFTIAIGSSHADKKIEGGLYHPVDLGLLKEIADVTGGGSYQANDAEAIQQVLQSILKQRQNLAKPKPQYQQQSLYFYPLAMALFLLVAWQIYSLLKTGGIRKEKHD